jgi:hypothetical protein
MQKQLEKKITLITHRANKNILSSKMDADMFYILLDDHCTNAVACIKYVQACPSQLG